MDYVRRFLFEDLDIRGAVVSLGNAWHEMHAGRDDPPAVNALLGELAAVTALIGGNLKTPGRITFQLQGHGQGQISLLLVDCDEQLRLRGTAKHAGAVSPAPTFTEMLGDGQLMLTLRTNIGDPYQSVVPLVGASLTAVFEHYLVQSEQQPAKLFLTASNDFAGGLFLQKLPDADAKDPDGWNRLLHLAATLKPAELAEPAAQLLMQLFPEENIRLFDPRPVRYYCPRDEEKVLAMLRSLGRAELEAALAEQGEIAVEDDICRQSYRFGPDIVPRLFD
ncbi:MAG: Hsp33 family molecular chaperone HslO [Rhodocyclaceae bacterium]|nr:Hsp33 family molecular chaperone HslO [Rhodocyclaceae bacterium]